MNFELNFDTLLLLHNSKRLIFDKGLYVVVFYSFKKFV
jgi:hypothetical protein